MKLAHCLSTAAASLAFALPLQAADYKVDIGASTEDGSLRVQPRIHGPAGKALRYEVDVRRAAGKGSANISQSGTVRLDDAGEAALSSNAVTLAPGERYDMTVKVYDGSRLVAQQSTSRP